MSLVRQLGPSSPTVSLHSGVRDPSDGTAMPSGEGGIPSEELMARETGRGPSPLLEPPDVRCEGRSLGSMECPVCLSEKPRDCFLEISSCHHRCCSKCLREYFKIEIMESRVAIACPECSELFHPNDIRAIVQDDTLMQKYEDFMLRRVLAMDSDTRWCPAPDCGFAVIATECAGCPKLKCERAGCDTYFCYHCKQYWHPNKTCDAARAERSPNMRSASVSYSQESGHHNEIKSCPRCGAFIVKMDDGSCNHMTCAVCGAGFCWLCMKEISDLHYLSPSGCTFWGRKPWSRKKKILWQLGTLVGAPVGITLVAGIAVPAMIIGIPVWVGRKIHFRYTTAEMVSKHRRNLAITGGVAASILAAPIIAGLAVGIGVPILLAYVYGVVPFSLCRSGGCGVTTTHTGGVRFEFDEDNENATQGPYSYGGDNHSMETAPNVANPSIAPSIGDASLGMTNSLSASGSHIERAGILRDDSDRDSSSHRAIAGNSINGSLCSATYSAQHHKLEVQADISEQTGQCERSSMGGESYNMSLNDDASTRALAGSIISPKDKDGISLCSRHFDGTAAPVVYADDSSSRGGEGCTSQSNGSGQQRGSSSCPTSPSLRKSSPVPSEDTRGSRGKKCTRFMDQVSEIESRTDRLSVGSILSSSSSSGSGSGASPSYDPGVTACPTQSTLSLTTTTTTTTTPATLASSESLRSEGQAEAAGVGLGKCIDPRVKAESTSVLVEGAELRRTEMGGARRKSDSTYREDLVSGECSLAGSWRKGGNSNDKEHRSQPGNLSDISEIRGMLPLHTSGCSNLLAVIDTSCENVFLDKTGLAKGRLASSLSGSSSEEMSGHQQCPKRRASAPGRRKIPQHDPETDEENGERTFYNLGNAPDTASCVQEVCSSPEMKVNNLDPSENQLGLSRPPHSAPPCPNDQRAFPFSVTTSRTRKNRGPFRKFIPEVWESKYADSAAGGLDRFTSSSMRTKRVCDVARTSIDSAATISLLPDVEGPDKNPRTPLPDSCRKSRNCSSSMKLSESSAVATITTPGTQGPSRDLFPKSPSLNSFSSMGTTVTISLSPGEHVPAGRGSEPFLIRGPNQSCEIHAQNVQGDKSLSVEEVGCQIETTETDLT